MPIIQRRYGHLDSTSFNRILNRGVHLEFPTWHVITQGSLLCKLDLWRQSTSDRLVIIYDSEVNGYTIVWWRLTVMNFTRGIATVELVCGWSISHYFLILNPTFLTFDLYVWVCFTTSSCHHPVVCRFSGIRIWKAFEA